jgi:hydrogenase/urease accessory protein HupE
MEPMNSKFFVTGAGFFFACITAPAFAHEGHGNSLLHALMHFLQAPDHLIMLGVAVVTVFAAWRILKGAKK